MTDVTMGSNLTLEEHYDRLRTIEHLCRYDDECEDYAVVDAWGNDGNPRPMRFWPLCFRHAVIAAIAHDPEAQSLALGWAVSRALGAPAVQS